MCSQPIKSKKNAGDAGNHVSRQTHGSGAAAAAVLTLVLSSALVQVVDAHSRKPTRDEHSQIVSSLVSQLQVLAGKPRILYPGKSRLEMPEHPSSCSTQADGPECQGAHVRRDDYFEMDVAINNMVYRAHLRPKRRLATPHDVLESVMSPEQIERAKLDHRLLPRFYEGTLSPLRSARVSGKGEPATLNAETMLFAEFAWSSPGGCAKPVLTRPVLTQEDVKNAESLETLPISIGAVTIELHDDGFVANSSVLFSGQIDVCEKSYQIFDASKNSQDYYNDYHFSPDNHEHHDHQHDHVDDNTDITEPFEEEGVAMASIGAKQTAANSNGAAAASSGMMAREVSNRKMIADTICSSYFTKPKYYALGIVIDQEAIAALGIDYIKMLSSYISTASGEMLKAINMGIEARFFITAESMQQNTDIASCKTFCQLQPEKCAFFTNGMSHSAIELAPLLNDIKAFAEGCKLDVGGIHFFTGKGFGTTLGYARTPAACGTFGHSLSVVDIQHPEQVFLHEIVHSFGANHDLYHEKCGKDAEQLDEMKGSNLCRLPYEYGCTAKLLMNPYSSPSTEFSPCAVNAICNHLSNGFGLAERTTDENLVSKVYVNRRKDLCTPNCPTCLHTSNNNLQAARCGNYVVEGDEECDPGPAGEDECCDTNCKLKKNNGQQCSHHNNPSCCNNCMFQPSGYVCRRGIGKCDVEEQCTGSSPVCPTDKHIDDGTYCVIEHPEFQRKMALSGKKGIGRCATGLCTSRDLQCWLHNSLSTYCGDDAGLCELWCTLPDGTCPEKPEGKLSVRPGSVCSVGSFCSAGSCKPRDIVSLFRTLFGEDVRASMIFGFVIAGMTVLSFLVHMWRIKFRRSFSEWSDAQRERLRQRAIKLQQQQQKEKKEKAMQKKNDLENQKLTQDGTTFESKRNTDSDAIANDPEGSDESDVKRRNFENLARRGEPVSVGLQRLRRKSLALSASLETSSETPEDDSAFPLSFQSTNP